jgi:hypothetical protein
VGEVKKMNYESQLIAKAEGLRILLEQKESRLLSVEKEILDYQKSVKRYLDAKNYTWAKHSTTSLEKSITEVCEIKRSINELVEIIDYINQIEA